MAYSSVTRRFSDGPPVLAGSQLNDAFDNLNGDTSAATAVLSSASIPRTTQARIGDHPTVFDFVTSTDNTSDYGPAVNRCLAAGYGCDIPTLLPVATPIVFPEGGSLLFGRNRMTCGFNVLPAAVSAMTTAGGLMTATSLAQGPTIENLGVYFSQPASGTSWVEYPPTLLLSNAARARLRSFRQQLGWGGIVATGATSNHGCGGLTVEDLESSCLGTNVSLDGCYDTVRFDNPHIWPFGWEDAANPNSANLEAFFTGTSSGYVIGRVDDLDVVNGLTFMSNALLLQAGADTNDTFGDFTTHDFDNFGGVNLNACLLSFNACKLTLGTVTSQCVIANDGLVHTNFNGCLFLVDALPAGTSGNSAVEIGAGSQVAISGGRLQLNVDAIGILAAAAGTDLVMNGLAVERIATGVYAQPAILVEGGARPTITGCSHTVMSTSVAKATFVDVSQDVAGVVACNSGGGTNIVFPAGYTLLQQGLNAGCTLVT